MDRATHTAYKFVFTEVPLGEKVLEDLCIRFWDISSFDAQNPHMTSFREGQRSVMKFILKQIQFLEKQEEVENENE
ncbi:MAG: Bbp19 family protein [Burkholderiales bacterium]